MIDIISKTIDLVLKPALNYAGEEISAVSLNKLLEYQINSYKYFSKVKTILYRTEPVYIEDVFFDIVINTNSTNVINDRDNGIESPIGFTKSFFRTKRNIIIGIAGSGKSMFMKHCFIKELATRESIPLFIELRKIDFEKYDLLGFIKNSILENEIATSNRILKRILETGKVKILLDGYDEVAGIHRRDLSKDIEKLALTFPATEIILTSRPGVYVEMLSSFSTGTIEPIGIDRAHDFIRKQLINAEDILTNNILQSIDRLPYSEKTFVVSTPLLLSLYILKYQNYSYSTNNITEMYAHVHESLLVSHDSISKVGFVREKLCNISLTKFNNILYCFAASTLFRNEINFSYSSIVEKVELILKRLNTPVLPENFVNDLQICYSIIIKDGIEFRFIHKSLHEYYSAKYIISVLSDEGRKTICKRIGSNIDIAVSKSHLSGKFVNVETLMSITRFLFSSDFYTYYEYIGMDLLEQCSKTLKGRVSTLSGIVNSDYKLGKSEIEYVSHTANVFFCIFSQVEDKSIIQSLTEYMTCYNSLVHKLGNTYESLIIPMETELKNDSDSNILLSGMVSSGIKLIQESEIFFARYDSGSHTLNQIIIDDL